MKYQRSDYVIFTDLDGTLLDHKSYSCEPARPALEGIRTRQIPLVFCTSKTRAEVEATRAALDNRDPFIVENGAAILIPRGYFPFPVQASRRLEMYEVIEFGVPYAEVVAALDRAAAASGCPVRGFHEMTSADVAECCGLSIAEAARAKQREYDEPFQVLTESPALICALLNQIEEQGLGWTRGGRFYHVRGDYNKGRAAGILKALYQRFNPGTITVGLGDGPNDLSLLQTVDVPFPLRTGPQGWNQAVLGIICRS